MYRGASFRLQLPATEMDSCDRSLCVARHAPARVIPTSGPPLLLPKQDVKTTWHVEIDLTPGAVAVTHCKTEQSRARVGADQPVDDTGTYDPAYDVPAPPPFFDVVVLLV